jgi:hypothetical protein
VGAHSVHIAVTCARWQGLVESSLAPGPGSSPRSPTAVGESDDANRNACAQTDSANAVTRSAVLHSQVEITAVIATWP